MRKSQQKSTGLVHIVAAIAAMMFMSATAFGGAYAETVAVRQISGPEINDRLSKVLAEAGANGHKELKFYNHNLQIYLPYGKSLTALKVDNIFYDRDSGQFSLTVHALDADGARNVNRISGQVIDLTNVPVLNDSIRRGDIITRSNIGWVSMATRRVSRNVITDKAELIGMSAVRSLAADRVIRESDIRRPILVKKGALVKVTVMTSRMTLTAIAKAMENGAAGDTIRLVNTSSHKNIEGDVQTDGNILITSLSRVALSRPN